MRLRPIRAGLQVCLGCSGVVFGCATILCRELATQADAAPPWVWRRPAATWAAGQVLVPFVLLMPKLQ